MVEIKELLKYNVAVRHRYWNCLSKLTWEEITSNRGASFQSMKNIFVHTLSAIDYWLDFLRSENLRDSKDYDDYSSFEEVRAYMEKIERRTNSYLESLSTEEIKKVYSAKDLRARARDYGNIVSVTAEDVLIHMFEEEVHHRGELIALLWQIKVEPPIMGWKGL